MSALAYQIEFTPAANRQFNKLPKKVQQRIERKVNELAIEPRPNGVKKLEDTDSFYRVPVGSYRIIYQILDAVLLVTVVRVAHRKELVGDAHPTNISRLNCCRLLRINNALILFGFDIWNSRRSLNFSSHLLQFHIEPVVTPIQVTQSLNDSFSLCC